MSDVVHLARLASALPSARVYERTCSDDAVAEDTTIIAKATCLACLLACAEYGSEARHRYEVLRDSGAKP